MNVFQPSHAWALKDTHEGASRLIHGRGTCLPVLFRTRKEAREYNQERFGYIKRRPDLRRAPHNWRMPVPVRVCITLEGRK